MNPIKHTPDAKLLFILLCFMLLWLSPVNAFASDSSDCPPEPVITSYSIALYISGDYSGTFGLSGRGVNFTEATLDQMFDYACYRQGYDHIPWSAYDWYTDQTMLETVDPYHDLYSVENIDQIHLYAVKKTHFTAGGEVGNGLLWRVTDDVLTISPSSAGNGIIPEGDTPWSDYHTIVTTLILEEGITETSPESFKGFRSLTSVSLPETLRTLGQQSFSECTALSAVELPDSLVKMGNFAFDGSGILSISVPHQIREIPYGCFRNCQSLTQVDLPSNLEQISNGAFQSCVSLESIILPDTVTEISALSFAYCTSLKNIVLSNNLVEIAVGAFEGCHSIMYLMLPPNLQIIGEYAFSGCSGLSSLSLPSGLTTIKKYAFNQCTALETVSIPGTVSSYESAFQGCTNLRSIQVAADNPVLASEDGVLFSKSMETLYTFPCAYEYEVYAIPDTVVSISQGAFNGCTGIRTIIWPGTLTCVWDGILNNIPNLEYVELSNGVTQIEPYAFSNTPNLQSVTLPVTIKAIGESAFEDSGLQSILIPESIESIGPDAFRNSRLSEIVIPRSVKSLGHYAFYGCPLTSVTVRGAIDTLNAYVFGACLKLESVYLPASVTAIKHYAFGNCRQLSDVYFEGTEDQWNAVLANDYYHYSTDYLPNATIHFNYRYPDESFSVILDSNGGKVEPSFITVKQGLPYGELPTPTRGEHVFDGWFTLPEGGMLVTAADTVQTDEPHTLYAHWTFVTPRYTVSFDANGGTVSETSRTVLVGERYGELPIPVWENYTFLGWFTAAKGGTRVTANTIADLTADQTLYAQWKFNIGVPSVGTQSAESVTKSSAVLKASVKDSGGDSDLSCSFIYWDKLKSSAKYTVSAEKNSDGDFQAVVKNLSPDTEYYYYAKLVNMAGEGVGKTASFRTQAENKLQSITVSPTYLELKQGETKQLLVSVLPETAENRNVVWESKAPEIVSVDQKGKLQANAVGKTEILVTTEENHLSASCTVVVKKNAIAGTFDFSEWNMATNTSVGAEDGTDWDTRSGGNNKIATSYLARWDGAVLEENDPYQASGAYQELSSDYHVQEVIWIPERESCLDNDEIKAAVMTYGAAYESFIVKYAYFNASRSTYYYPESGTGKNGGHAVAVVGWDDNFPASNFTVTPPGNGAFICKNSWGTNSGDGGYFYISYYDKYFGRQEAGAVVTSLESNSNYNTIYQYDPLGPCTSITPTKYEANVFPQQGHVLNQNEWLRAVAFYTGEKNTTYDVYVVTDYQNRYSLCQRIPVASGTIAEMGYHTVVLDSPVVLAQGTRFGIVVRLSSGGEYYNYYVEGPIKGNSSNARAGAEESFYSADGQDWGDLAAAINNFNFCIKAFTDNGLASRSSTLYEGIDNDARYYESDRVYSLEEVMEAGCLINPDYVEWARQMQARDNGDDEMPLGNIPSIIVTGDNTVSFVDGTVLPSSYDMRDEGYVTDVRDQGNYGTCWAHAMYASLESYLLKLEKTVDTSAIGDLYTLDDLIMLMDSAAPTQLLISKSSVALSVGETIRLIASYDLYGGNDAVLWSSSDPEIAEVDTNGVVTALQPGDVLITARSTDGELEAACQISVTEDDSLQDLSFAEHELAKPAGSFFLADYKLKPSLAEQPLFWSSSDPDVVAVNNRGVMLALKAGTAAVTVKTKDGSCLDTATVTVYEDAGYLAMRLPAALTRIDESAFEGDALRYVFLGNWVTEIGERAFADCSALRLIVIPDSVTSIGADAFLGCRGITFVCEEDSTAHVYAAANSIDFYIPG